MHAARMRELRKRQRPEKIVTHQGHPPPDPPAIEAKPETESDKDSTVVYCDFCGRPRSALCTTRAPAHTTQGPAPEARSQTQEGL